MVVAILTVSQMRHFLSLTLLLISLDCFQERFFSLIPCALAQDVTFDWESVQPSDTLHWVDCYTGLQCARYNVPRNYSDSSLGSIAVALTRLPSNLSSTDPEYRGPLLFNPGGPGDSGVDSMTVFGSIFAELFGPEFDIVSFDPRGVGHSTPQISFFASEAERAKMDIADPFFLSVNATSDPDNLAQAWAKAQILGQFAKDHDSEGILPHITTDNVARDMLSIVEAHNRTKINYYGVSYGTALGATFATLFPNKIERMALDVLRAVGVLQTSNYYASDLTPQQEQTDKSAQLFFNGCFSAGPENCAFYEDSAKKIEQNFFALLETLRTNPVPVYDSTTSTSAIIDSAAVREVFETILYGPYRGGFSNLAEGLAALANDGDGTYFLQQLDVQPLSSNNTSGPNVIWSTERQFEAILAIACTDGVAINDSVADLMAYYERASEVTKFADLTLVRRYSCSGWRVHPDHFTGPIGGNTSFPILFAGNTADPITPVSAARNMSAIFPGSVVLVQDSGGHSLLSTLSTCAFTHLITYFQNGTLPEPGTVCPIDLPLFPPPASINASVPTPTIAKRLRL